MRGMQRPGLAAVEALGKIFSVPEIEVGDLWSVNADDPEEMSCRDRESAPVPGRHNQLIKFAPAGAGSFVELGVETRKVPDRIGDDRPPSTPRGGISRGDQRAARVHPCWSIGEIQAEG